MSIFLTSDCRTLFKSAHQNKINPDYEVSAMNPMIAMQVVKNPKIESEAKDVDQKLQNIIKSI